MEMTKNNSEEYFLDNKKNCQTQFFLVSNNRNPVIHFWPYKG